MSRCFRRIIGSANMIPDDATFMVTGGAGFIGSHLVLELVRRGARRVVVLDSLRYGDPGNLGNRSDRIEIFKHRLGFDPKETLAAALDGVTHLFHLAAEKHNQSKDDPGRVFQANLNGMHDLVEQACRSGVRKVVFSSSLYAHGRLVGADLSEEDVPAPRTVYGITKLAGEHLLRYFQEHRGIRWNALRYLFVYGPKQFSGMGYRSVIVKNFERLLRGEDVIVCGDGEQQLDYVFVSDAVDATMRAMFSEVDAEVMNVASGKGTSVNSLLDKMIEVSGHAAGKVTEAADWTAGTRRVGATEKAERLLGWRATTSLEAGLSETFRWMKERRAAEKCEPG
jgi:UDP-glucose 4-epimerase